MPPEPFALVALLAAGAVYTRGLARLWQRATFSHALLRQKAIAFAAGLLTILFALESPLDDLSAQLFTAHMVQHLLLILVGGPLLVLGAPASNMLWALPRAARRALGGAWKRVAWMELPSVAFVLHSLALWAWHIPAIYDAALTSRPVHGLEHATLLATSALFWWAVLRTGRAGAGVLSVFGLAVQSTLLGALLSFAPSPWYASHVTTTAAFGITPLEDQQLAGLIMWIPAGLIYLVAALGLFGAWLKQPALDRA